MNMQDRSNTFDLNKYGVGQPVPRTEDPALLRGEGRYTDDLNEPGQAYAYIVRSQYAHGLLKKIETEKALAMPGVLAIYTGKDLEGYGTHKCIAPLVNRDGMPELARELYEGLRSRIPAEYDAGGSIGKRYRRQDEIGTPYGVTVDHQTLEDRTVTLRDRDTLTQERVAIDELPGQLTARLAAPWRSPKLASG